MELYYEEIDTPIGLMTVVTDQGQIVRMDYGAFGNLESLYRKWSARHFDNPDFVHKPGEAPDIKRELREFFHDARHYFICDVVFHGTPFQKQVWQALYESIPCGETKTYKEIAEMIGNPKAVRAVGGAVNKNPLSIVVPCHRVIGANGKLVGYNGGLDKKEFLLAHEQRNA